MGQVKLGEDWPENYVLSDQIGYILRKANQRHAGIFSETMPADLTPTRFSAMVKLLELGSLSQNELGRHTAMDIATIKGVVDRLRSRGLVESKKDSKDARRQLIELTPKGKELILSAIPLARQVSKKTTDTLTKSETLHLSRLLHKIT